MNTVYKNMTLQQISTSHLFIVAVITLALTVSANTMAAETQSGHGNNMISVFLGGAQKDDHGEDLTEFAWGIGYLRKLSHRLSIQVLYEEIGGDIDTRALIVPLHVRLGDSHWAFLAGPGVEHKNAKDEDVFLFRVGIGYEFEVGNGWAITPELSLDWLDVDEGDDTVVVFGASVGRFF